MKNIIDRYNGEEKEPIQKFDISKINQQTHSTHQRRQLQMGEYLFFLLKKIKLWIKREKIPGKHTRPNINNQQNKNATGELPLTK